MPKKFWLKLQKVWPTPKIYLTYSKNFLIHARKIWPIPKNLWSTLKNFWPTAKCIWPSPKKTWPTPKRTWLTLKNIWPTPKKLSYVGTPPTLFSGILARITKYVELPKRRILINTYFKSQFNYYTAIWMFHSHSWIT